MPEDLNDLLNGHLDGRLTPAQEAKLALRLKKPVVAKRLVRLRALRVQVRAALPRPSAEQSRRMWEAIRAQLPAGVRVEAAKPWAPAELVSAQAHSIFEPWVAFFSKPWAPVWSAGLAGAAVLVWVFLAYPRLVLRPSASPESVPVVPAAQSVSAPLASNGGESGTRPTGRASVLAKTAGPAGSVYASVNGARERSGSKALRLEPAASAPAATVVAGLPSGSAPAPASSAAAGPTEVERALADNQADAMIQQFLQVRPQASVPVVAMFAPSPEAPSADLGGGGEDTVSYEQAPAPVLQDVSSGVPGLAKGGKDGNGYWDWSPAAVSLNQRDWRQARVELQAAARTGSVAEKAFADSALGLLSASGAPLEGIQALPPATDDLRVLSAGTWQLLVDSRLARFGQGVSVYLPGLREDGDSFLLDLTFNRGEFAPGSHFVRVAGASPGVVLDASGRPVTANDFYAPAGADYSISDHVLRLR